jgi:hypothetical protein
VRSVNKSFRKIYVFCSFLFGTTTRTIFNKKLSITQHSQTTFTENIEDKFQEGDKKGREDCLGAPVNLS